MKLSIARCWAFLFLVSIGGTAMEVHAQSPEVSTAQMNEMDGSALAQQLQEREEKIQKLTDAEREALRVAQQRAAEDPDVKAALEARNQAMTEFRKVYLESVVRADPEVARIFEKMYPAAPAPLPTPSESP